MAAGWTVEGAKSAVQRQIPAQKTAGMTVWGGIAENLTVEVGTVGLLAGETVLLAKTLALFLQKTSLSRRR